MRRKASDTSLRSDSRSASNPFPASPESGGVGLELRGLAPALLQTTREVLRGHAVCRDLLCARGEHSDFGFGGGEHLFSVANLVINRLGSGEERFVRPFAQQVIRQVQLLEDVPGSCA